MPDPPVDAIVLLGCRVGPGGWLSDAARRRSATAARAWHEGVAPCIVASGGKTWQGAVEAEVLASELVARGVDPDAIVRETCSTSTLTNAWYSSHVLATLGAERAAIVTCDWHMPRAIASFERVGAPVVPLPALSPRGRVPPVSGTRLREAISLWLQRVELASWG